MSASTVLSTARTDVWVSSLWVLTGQVTHLRALEKENGKLQRRVDTYERQHANVEILKEQNKALEKRVHGLDELRAKMAAQEAELKSLQREKSDWYSLIASLHGG